MSPDTERVPLARETRVPPDLSEDPEGEHCYDCGKAVGVVWTAPDAMWAEVTGNDHGGGLLCIRCFDIRAEAQGRFIRWIPDGAQAGPPPLDYPVLVNAIRQLYTRGNYLGKRAEDDVAAILAEVARLGAAPEPPDPEQAG